MNNRWNTLEEAAAEEVAHGRQLRVREVRLRVGQHEHEAGDEEEERDADEPGRRERLERNVDERHDRALP
jgi:hypothetical protein